MPVADGVFSPNAPLVRAETVVAWERINRTVLVERDRIERALAPLSKRLGYAVGAGLHSAKLTNELQQKFAAHLTRVYRFGMAESRRELADLRSREAASAPALAARREDVGPGAAKRRFDQLAGEAAAAIERAALAGDGEVAASGAAVKQLHLSVLETVGLALNLGRAEGAATASPAPIFAMRSAQLDKNSCGACESLHGEIVQADSDRFYEVLPPAECRGAGRCRCVVIFADGVRDLRQPE